MLPKISDVKAVDKAQIVRPLTEINERECVARLAAKVPDGGLIVEIGTLYGGMTAVMGLANKKARIITIDNFSWHPADDVPTSKKLVLENMTKVGVKNVEVMQGDSRVIGKSWKDLIDLVFIDGGHSFDWVYPDLCNFAPHAQVVALHDYDNPFWKTIRKAVEKFLGEHPQWEVDDVVGTVAVLRRKAG
jgi:Predicted O-methyltransferase